MGEYVKLPNGEDVKLGTCENLYYITFETAKRLLPICRQLEGNFPPEEYLNPAHGWRYRFPFPNEDNIEIYNGNDFERAAIITAPEGFDIEDHDPIYHHCTAKGGYGYQVNVKLECPAKNNANKARPVAITQQKQVDGELWTVAECGWCGSCVRLPREDAMLLVNQIRKENPDPKNGNYKFWQTIADRIEAGYKTPVVIEAVVSK